MKFKGDLIKVTLFKTSNICVDIFDYGQIINIK